MADTTNERRTFGSYYFRKDRGKWAARVPTGKKTKSGGTARKVYLFDTEEQAQAFLDEAAAAHEAGELVIDGEAIAAPLTVAGAVEAYIEANEERLSANTLVGYRASLSALRAEGSPLADVPVADVTDDHVRAYRAWRREHVFRTMVTGPRDAPEVKIEHREGKTASPATVNRDQNLLEAALNRLAEKREIPVDVYRNIRGVKKAKETQRKGGADLSDDEVARVLRAAPGYFRPLVVTALYTGARKEEILALRWGDVNFGAGMIRLERTKVHLDESIPMHPVLAEELDRLRKDRTKALGRVPRADEAVFLSSRGAPIKDIRKAWAKTLKDAGLADRKGLVFHSTRHTFATSWTGDPRILQAILGHSRIETTLKYSAIRDERKRREVAAFGYGSTPAGAPEGSAPGQVHPECTQGENGGKARQA